MSVLRRALHHRRVEPVVSAMLRGRLTKTPLRFAMRELTDSSSTHVYRIRSSGLRVQITHGSPDVLTLDQAFYQHVYEPPPAALARLGERPLRALDLGANIGMWGLWAHGRFQVGRILALEPDPENATKHRRQIELNGLGSSWELLQAAATGSDGPVVFTTGRATTGRIGEPDEPGAAQVAGRDVFALMQDVDLLKIDIEGAEWQLLEDERFQTLDVPVVMLEYHPHGAPSENPEADAGEALAGIGMQTISMHGAPDKTGIVWGWRTYP